MMKYLLVDIGDSGILSMVCVGNPVTNILSIARDIKNGSALQLGNAESNYIFHKKEIITKLKTRCKEYGVETVCINLPSQYDSLVVLPSTVNSSTLFSEIVKSDEYFSDEDTVPVYGQLKKNDTGFLITAVSAVNKDYFEIVNSLKEEGLEVNITTSFTRLQLLASDKVDLGLVNDNFIIVDAGYSKTRAILFDSTATPISSIFSTLSGRDIVEKMSSGSALDSDNDFMNKVNLNDSVKSYINSNAAALIKQIKAKTRNKPCKIFMYGGLSVLSWTKLSGNYDIEIMTCKPIVAKNKHIATKTALMFDTPFETCNTVQKRVADKRVKRSKSKSNLVNLDEDTPTEEAYVESVYSTEKNSTKHKKQLELEDEDEPKQKLKKIKKVKREKPKDEEEEEDNEKSLSPKTLIMIGITAILVVIACVVTVGMFMDYKSNAKESEITAVNQKASLITYAQKVIDSKNISISDCKSEIVGGKEFLSIGFTDISRVALEDLLSTISTDCDVTQSDVVYTENDTVSLTLTLSFR